MNDPAMRWNLWPGQSPRSARSRTRQAIEQAGFGDKTYSHLGPPVMLQLIAARHRLAGSQQEDRMEAQKLHRGRLIDHLQLVVADFPASRRLYSAIMEVLDIPAGGEGDNYIWFDELFISTPDSEAAAGELTGRHHLAFQARDRAMVEKFHKVALANGGRDNGGPGEREYHPGYYAAFVLDPDGNNIEAVFHGPANISARSVEVTF
jgi:catechol 2,3-dioxygenase-like lactoylglutathione lyase family enzyme